MMSVMSVSDGSGVQATYLQASSHSTRSQAAQAEPSVTQVLAGDSRSSKADSRDKTEFWKKPGRSFFFSLF